MYSALYDSMIAWYRQWYSGEWQLHFLTVIVLSTFMGLNLYTVENVLLLNGFHAWRREIAIPLLCFVAVANCLVAIAKTRSESAVRRENSISVPSRRLALGYMSITLVCFFGSFLWLWVVKANAPI